MKTKRLFALGLAGFLLTAASATALLANGSVKVKVIGLDGKPAVGAAVQIYYTQMKMMQTGDLDRQHGATLQQSGRRVVVGKGMTDANGDLVVPNLPPRNYRYRVTAEGATDATGEVAVEDGKQATLDVKLTQ